MNSPLTISPWIVIVVLLFLGNLFYQLNKVKDKFVNENNDLKNNLKEKEQELLNKLNEQVLIAKNNESELRVVYQKGQ